MRTNFIQKQSTRLLKEQFPSTSLATFDIAGYFLHVYTETSTKNFPLSETLCNEHTFQFAQISIPVLNLHWEHFSVKIYQTIVRISIRIKNIVLVLSIAEYSLAN
jgi:hypothetical protein